jgi:hypothetical protein
MLALSTAPVLANDVPTNDIALFELSDFHSAVNELKPAKKVVKRIRTEADYLAHWKEKQEALWANLPTEDFTINASQPIRLLPTSVVSQTVSPLRVSR